MANHGMRRRQTWATETVWFQEQIPKANITLRIVISTVAIKYNHLTELLTAIEQSCTIALLIGKDYEMKKMIAVLLVAVFGMMSVSAMACPRGTHPHGGTGSHHAGGTCY